MAVGLAETAMIAGHPRLDDARTIGVCTSGHGKHRMTQRPGQRRSEPPHRRHIERKLSCLPAYTVRSKQPTHYSPYLRLRTGLIVTVTRTRSTLLMRTLGSATPMLTVFTIVVEAPVTETGSVIAALTSATAL